MRDQGIAARVLRAWTTLVIGLLFFLAATWMNRREEDVRFSVRWLLVGLAIDIAWSGVQAATFYLNLLPKPLVTQWQRAFSLRELIRTNRVSGLAYEPSWLAGQISTIYLPWLFAGLLTGQRASRSKWLEPCLFVLTLLLLLVTFSRGGILTAAFALAATTMIAGRQEIAGAWKWFIAGFRTTPAWISRVALILVFMTALVGAGLFLGQKGYFSRIWNTRAENVVEFLVQNSAGARGAYAAASMRAYADHPWTGVGLGASGFYIYANLPDWSLTTVPEIARQLSPQNNLYPNPKNLYVRLLAETGLFGFVLFLAFQLSLLGTALLALRSARRAVRWTGVSAVFTLAALLAYNITQDSFANPNLWINLGILAGLLSTPLLSTQPGQMPGGAGTSARQRFPGLP
jgi:O-antigen ligase